MLILLLGFIGLVGLSADSLIEADFWIEVGYTEGSFGNWEYEPYFWYEYEPFANGYVELGVNVYLLKYVFVGGSITTMIDTDSGKTNVSSIEILLAQR